MKKGMKLSDYRQKLIATINEIEVLLSKEDILVAQRNDLTEMLLRTKADLELVNARTRVNAHEYSFEEIGKRLNVSKQRAKQLFDRALEKLRKHTMDSDIIYNDVIHMDDTAELHLA